MLPAESILNFCKNDGGGGEGGAGVQNSCIPNLPNSAYVEKETEAGLKNLKI